MPCLYNKYTESKYIFCDFKCEKCNFNKNGCYTPEYLREHKKQDNL